MAMDVHISNISGHGDAEKEYVYIKVDNDCDIGHYLLGDTTYTAEGSVSNKLRHIYWFPDKKVKAGDVVVLRTGKGTNTSEKMDDGHTKHRFYWQLGSAVWNNDGDAAVLLRAPEWKHRKGK